MRLPDIMGISGLGSVEQDVFGAAPEHFDTQLAQIFRALDDTEKVIARELPHLACESTATVGDQDFSFA